LALATAAVLAAGSAFALAAARRPAAALPYDLKCLALKAAEDEINAQARQDWTVRAMAIGHQSPGGQECLLVLFERGRPN
jgi:hypothetical protein